MNFKKITLGIFGVVLLGLLIPEEKTIPVRGASTNDWNKNSFWYEPWGASGVHKGVDIFAKSGTDIVASSNQIVLYRGEFEKGGKVVFALGAGWRLHYYAHLKSIDSDGTIMVEKGHKIGEVGNTGNAQGKQPHLHYSIVSFIPLVWKIDGSTQGYKKAFYINPISYFQ